MWRSVLAWLIIGSLVTLFLWGIYQTPVAEDLQSRTFGFYQTDPVLFGDLGLVPIRWLQYLVIGVAAFGVAWVVIEIPRTSHRILFAAMAIAVVIGLSPALAIYAKLFEPLTGTVAVLMSLGLGLIYTASEWGRRKHHLSEVFGGQVNKATMAELLNQKAPPALEGDQHDVVILTVRLFNHGELAESMEPGELVELTNQFLSATSEFLCVRGGYLDESSPDCVRVFFGLPVADPQAPKNACGAALELRLRLANLAVECESQWTQRIEYGIALCAGSVTSGIFGESRQRHFSAVGSQVDLCRRLTIANRTYGSRILADSGTYHSATTDYEFRPLDRFFVPGSEVVTEFYELLEPKGRLSEAAEESREHFWEGIIHLRNQKAKEALAAFEKAREVAGPKAIDPPLLHYLEEAREMAKSGNRKLGARSTEDIQQIGSL